MVAYCKPNLFDCNTVISSNIILCWHPGLCLFRLPWLFFICILKLYIKCYIVAVARYYGNFIYRIYSETSLHSSSINFSLILVFVGFVIFKAAKFVWLWREREADLTCAKINRI